MNLLFLPGIAVKREKNGGLTFFKEVRVFKLRAK